MIESISMILKIADEKEVGKEATEFIERSAVKMMLPDGYHILAAGLCKTYSTDVDVIAQVAIAITDQIMYALPMYPSKAEKAREKVLTIVMDFVGESSELAKRAYSKVHEDVELLRKDCV